MLIVPHCSHSPLTPQHQLELIVDLLGTPDENTIAQVHVPKAREYMRGLPHRDPTPWRSVAPDASADALDLLSKLLLFDPAQRFTAEDALAHDYMAALHCPEDEPTGERPPPLYFEFENHQPSEGQYRGEWKARGRWCIRGGADGWMMGGWWVDEGWG